MAVPVLLTPPRRCRTYKFLWRDCTVGVRHRPGRPGERDTLHIWCVTPADAPLPICGPAGITTQLWAHTLKDLGNPIRYAMRWLDWEVGRYGEQLCLPLSA